MMPSTTYCHACAQLRDECAEAAKLVAKRDRQITVLRKALEGAKMAVEDYISRIEKHGFKESFGRGVLREIDAAIAQTED